MALTISVTVQSKMVLSSSTGTLENGKITTTSQNVFDHSWTRFRRFQRYVQVDHGAGVYD
jgi:hypothetical protein